MKTKDSILLENAYIKILNEQDGNSPSSEPEMQDISNQNFENSHLQILKQITNLSLSKIENLIRSEIENSINEISQQSDLSENDIQIDVKNAISDGLNRMLNNI